MDAVVLFFLLGVAAKLVRSDLRLPEAMYEGLSIFLLLAIGLQGGVKLAEQSLSVLLPQCLAVIMLGALLPLIAFPILRKWGRFGRADAAAISAHYGSVSVVTFAVGTTLLTDRGIAFEAYLPVFVVLLEMPGIAVGILLAKGLRASQSVAWHSTLREVFFGRSLLLLGGGLAIGWVAGADALHAQGKLFFDLFKGLLALFMLEMGIVAASRLKDLRQSGVFLVLFGTLAPCLFAVIGAVAGRAMGLSVGGSLLLATLAASASYIAAPAAIRIAIPQANPSLSLAASLGITFPFNVTVGIPLYLMLVQWMHQL